MNRQAVARIISVLTGAAALFALDQGLGVPLANAIPLAVIVYFAVKLAFDLLWAPATRRRDGATSSRSPPAPAPAPVRPVVGDHNCNSRDRNCRRSNTAAARNRPAHPCPMTGAFCCNGEHGTSN